MRSRPASYVPQVGTSMPISRAIWKRVRMSARRVKAKRAPISWSEVSGILHPPLRRLLSDFDTETNFTARRFMGGLPPNSGARLLVIDPHCWWARTSGGKSPLRRLSPALVAGLFFLRPPPLCNRASAGCAIDAAGLSARLRGVVATFAETLGGQAHPSLLLNTARRDFSEACYAALVANPLKEALTALADALAKRPVEEILFDWFRSGRLVGELSVLIKRGIPRCKPSSTALPGISRS